LVLQTKKVRSHTELPPGQYTFNADFFASIGYLQAISLQPAVAPAAKAAAQPGG